MSMHHAMLDSLPLPSPSQIAYLRLAASQHDRALTARL